MSRYVVAALLVALVGVSLAPAWWVKGHGSIAEAAVSPLPDDMPAFFRAGAKHLAHCAGDPDRWKNPAAHHLRAAEAPDHFLDLENYDNNELPADRYQAISLLLKLKQHPERTGMLPYAIMENYDRLTCAFYDYRAEPDNAAVQAKCLTYAGVLAHFTGDLAMPLHTTRDFDGKKGADGKLVQKGIHAKIDAFPEKNGLAAEEIGRELKAKPIEDVWTHVMKQIKESHSQVGRCYELDAAGAFDQPTPESRAFILERCRAGAQLTADLWYSAWLRSAKLPAPY
jgi:hypothetical protein